MSRNDASINLLTASRTCLKVKSLRTAIMHVSLHFVGGMVLVLSWCIPFLLYMCCAIFVVVSFVGLLFVEMCCSFLCPSDTTPEAYDSTYLYIQPLFPVESFHAPGTVCCHFVCFRMFYEYISFLYSLFFLTGPRVPQGIQATPRTLQRYIISRMRTMKSQPQPFEKRLRLGSTFGTVWQGQGRLGDPIGAQGTPSKQHLF